VRDFTTVFDTYAQFEESVLSAKMAAEDDDEDEDEVRDAKLEKDTATHPFVHIQNEKCTRTHPLPLFSLLLQRGVVFFPRSRTTTRTWTAST
jgi:hypothetical protein